MSRTCTQIELIFRIGETGIDTPLTSNREGFERLFGAPDPRSVSTVGCRLRRLEIGPQQVERLLPHSPPIPRHRFGRVVGDVHGGLRPFRIEFVRYRGHHGSILFCERPRKGELPRTLDRRDRRLKSSIRKRRLIHAADLGIDADVVSPPLDQPFRIRERFEHLRGNCIDRDPGISQDDGMRRRGPWPLKMPPTKWCLEVATVFGRGRRTWRISVPKVLRARNDRSADDFLDLAEPWFRRADLGSFLPRPPFWDGLERGLELSDPTLDPFSEIRGDFSFRHEVAE